MLILSRRVNESIDIGHDIQISVVEIKGSRVRLAISAPRSVPILRSELPKHATVELEARPQLPPATAETSLSSFVIESV